MFKTMTVEDYHEATIEELANALDALVTELVSYRRRQPPAEGSMVSSAVLFKIPDGILRERSIVDKPMEWAIKQGIKEIGKLMFKRLGNTEAMVPIAEDVADRDHKRYGMRISIIDHTFNGIGEKADRWWS